MAIETVPAPCEPPAPFAPGWKSAAAYVLLLVGGIGLFFLIRQFGEAISAPEAPAGAVSLARPKVGQVDVVFHFLAALAAMVSLGYLIGRAFVLVGQPPVIGEVIAGIALGPSLLGAISPAAMHFLLPGPDGDPHGQVGAAIRAVSQLGVVLYMFLVGLELNAARLRHQANAAVAVSLASIVAPFVLGAGLALWLYPALSHRGVPFTSFALFMGVAMSITAFPVLARILTDRRLDKTDLGVFALGCAAANDVKAWCLLALVVGVAQAQFGGVLLVCAGAAGFIAGMFLVVGPLTSRLSRWLDARPGPLPSWVVPGGFVAVLVAALTTEVIGVHAVFGAFLLGAVIPHDGRLANEFTRKLTDLVTVILLPAFFAYTGMRTQVGLVSGWGPWLMCAAIVAVATLGKFGGTFAAARLTGQDTRTAVALGALMNTRGLVELIVLNIGLDLGVISPTLFAMMVVMALVTTMTTAPVLSRLGPVAAAHPA